MKIKPIGRGLKLMSSGFEAAANRELSALGLTAAQAQLLIILNSSNDTLRLQKSLAAELGASQACVTGIISRLGEQGFVRLSRDGEDRRNRLISLTPKGEDICQKAHEALVRACRDYFSPLTDEELGQLSAIVKKLGFEDI